MPKICMVLPYFGKLPSYWGGAITSLQDNYILDFLIISDCDIRSSSENIKIVKMSWKKMQEYVKKKFEEIGYKKICITHPYKLCDYKPSYGYLFESYLKDYDFWGYMDCDLVLGNVKKFLTKIDVQKFDRIGRYGHFSLYRNTPVVNKLFADENIPSKIHFSDVIKTTFPYHFDEGTINEFFYKKNLKFYDKPLDATMGIFSYEFKWKNQTSVDLGELFVIEPDGASAVYSKTADNGIERSEVMYIHFLNKKDIFISEHIKKPYCITRKGVFEIRMSDIPTLIDKAICTIEEQNAYQRNLERKARKMTRKRIIREMRYNKLEGCKFIYNRVQTWWQHRLLARKYNRSVNENSKE